LLHWCLCCLGK